LRVAAERERVLPTGAMHFAVRLSDAPLRLFGRPDDATGYTVGHAVVGGARTTAYLRDISVPSRSVGAQLHPGACEILFGIPAGELSERHTPLEAIWGSGAASELRERLLAAGSLQQQLELFESALAARLPRVRGVHPAVAHALERFAGSGDVGQVVRETGYSHRRFLALFRETVGLAPKVYCRILRFQQAVQRLAPGVNVAPIEVALEAGYSDQSHLNREFREFSGLTPGEYRKASPLWPSHVPLRGQAVQFYSRQTG
jgi:AraC-like DNA-binding protein